MAEPRLCAYCKGPIPTEGKRRYHTVGGAEVCSAECRDDMDPQEYGPTAEDAAFEDWLEGQG